MTRLLHRSQDLIEAGSLGSPLSNCDHCTIRFAIIRAGDLLRESAEAVNFERTYL